jgi:hypothetical protein
MDAISRMKNIYFLAHLTPEELEALAGMMHLQPYTGGEQILSQHDPTINFYIVDDGYVNLRMTDPNGFENAVGSKGPGDFFGVKMFTTQEPSEYSFDAVGPAALWVIERQDFDALLEKFPDVLDHMPELKKEYAHLTRGLEWLAPGEIVHILTRRHWWAFVLMIRLPVILVVILTIALWISWRFKVLDILPWVWYVFAAGMGVSLLLFLWNLVDYWNDYYVVTNKRIVEVNEVVLISHEQNEVAIEKIQAQQVERGGPISVFLNISNLIITTAADRGELVFRDIGNIAAVQKAIAAEQAHIAERKRVNEREHFRSLISGDIRHYVLQQPNPADKKPSAPLPPPPFTRRLAVILDSWFGTEIRTDKAVTWRKHRIVLLRQVAASFAIFLFATGILLIILLMKAEFGLARNGVYFGLGVIMLAALTVSWWQWQDWRVDLYRLTENEIVDIQSMPFGLNYRENKADLSKIQDVVASQSSLISTTLNMGDVQARVAGNAEPFTFESISNPREVANEIQKRIEAVKVRSTERQLREQTRQFVDAIVAYHRLVNVERNQNQAPAQLPSGAVNPPLPPTTGQADIPKALPAETLSDQEFPPETDLAHS